MSEFKKGMKVLITSLQYTEGTCSVVDEMEEMVNDGIYYKIVRVYEQEPDEEAQVVELENDFCYDIRDLVLSDGNSPYKDAVNECKKFDLNNLVIA